MEMTVRVVCRPEIAAGFQLAGLVVEEADEATAGQAIRRLAYDSSAGIVLLEDRLHRSLPEDLMQRLDRLATPIVVPFPSPSWRGSSAHEEYVLEILRQAVGYRVRLR